MLLQKAATENIHIHQMDVKGAYLNAPIDKEFYVQQPPGYVKLDENGTPLTCHLKKSLYGLKQSGRNWHSTLTDFLKSQGFISNKTDPCIYTNFHKGDQVIILFWVDDIIICSNTLPLLTHVKNMLSSHFHMDDRGELKWFLGIDFQRLDNGNYVMSQERYLEPILDRFSMSDCKPVNTPAEINLHLQSRENDKIPNFPFRQVIGSLVYLSVATRPDISWVISKLSQHLEKPTDAHIAAVKRVLRYLKGTKSLKIIFKPSDGQLIAYTDSNWANDLNDRRSISGFVVTLGSAPISWRSRKQPTVALSSCEAEYIALAEAVKEILYLRSLCLELAIEQSSSTVLFCDNQGALALTKEKSKQHQRTKHIDVKYHFIREQRDIDYRYIATNENLADIFTKALSKVPHQNILKGLQIEGAC